jgi:membrane fusion protein, multidrug efflux system
MNFKLNSLLLLVALSIVSCGDTKHTADTAQSEHTSEEHPHHADSKFLVTNPIRRDTTMVKQYVCQLKAINHIEIRALERGYLDKIYVDEGEMIKKGQIMFQILPNVYKAELKKAQAEARISELKYNNTKLLADDKVVSKNELAIAEAEYQKAQAEVDLVQTHLGFTQIKAPFTGLMDKFKVRPGSLLEEGELLTELSDNSQMWAYFNVAEAEYLDYKMHIKKDRPSTVKLKMANNLNYNHDGKVTTIEADFNPETGNIAFRATFPNPQGLLRHGETGNILMYQPARNALLVPQKATYQVLDNYYVYVVTADGTVKAKEIKLAGELQHLFIVASGLDTNDQILLDGLKKVSNGMKIKYEKVAGEKVLSNLGLYAE